MRRGRTRRAEVATAAALACVALGGNQGDVVTAFRHARRALGTQPGAAEVAASWIYRTAPIGFAAQPDFCNAVLAIRTPLTPIALLESMLELERQTGRQRGSERNGPRPLDLDLLLHDDTELALPELSLPHPRLTHRAFVLAPLIDVLGPHALVAGQPLKHWLAQCSGQRVLRLLSPDAWS